MSAERAYNAHAMANDMPTIAVDFEKTRYNDTYTDFGMLYGRSPATGNVGMDKTIVKIAFDGFTKNMVKAIKMIDNTPYDIAFYDEDGSQIATYKAEISKMKKALEDELDALKRELTTALEEEVQSVEIAARKATSELQSSGTTTQL